MLEVTRIMLDEREGQPIKGGGIIDYKVGVKGE